MHVGAEGSAAGLVACKQKAAVECDADSLSAVEVAVVDDKEDSGHHADSSGVVAAAAKEPQKESDGLDTEDRRHRRSTNGKFLAELKDGKR